eukprot:2256755-Prymnesium_polylepis.1
MLPAVLSAGSSPLASLGTVADCHITHALRRARSSGGHRRSYGCWPAPASASYDMNTYRIPNDPPEG